MPKKQTPLPQTGGSFTRQKDGTLKPAEDEARPEQDLSAVPANSGKD
jgi:hypothetical protein